LDLLEEILNKAVMVILEKAGFNSKIFQDYLVGRKTKYLWNTFSSSSFNVDISVGQGSTLSSILYLSPIFYIFEKRIKKHYLKSRSWNNLQLVYYISTSYTGYIFQIRYLET